MSNLYLLSLNTVTFKTTNLQSTNVAPFQTIFGTMSAKPKTTHQELCKLMANAKLDNPADLRVAFDKAMAALGSVLDKKELQSKIKT